MRTERLTGNQRYRTGWFGKQILQVEVEGEFFDSNLTWSPTFSRWRDANVFDVQGLVKKSEVDKCL